MKFIHFRDQNKLLWATIAYETYSDTKVAYGVSIVSRREPRGRVSYKTARCIAINRCNQAKGFAVGGNVPWGRYVNEKLRPAVQRLMSPVLFFRKSNINKIGVVSTKEFFTSIKSIKESFESLDSIFTPEARR